ncbi:hypothetical protein J2T17_002895 [Paenibacillus mucilaginosus]|uniref:hypothetical protein n=1 Tax=Paenibacillus mucilaginosus TaxID=61624 RepID=UPI003D193BAA
MAAYWLVPLDAAEEAVVLGGDRILLEPEERRTAFMETLKELHPRLALTFKSHLLPGEEEAEACGLDAGAFALSGGESIHLRHPGGKPGDGWVLSHCAEAYLDRLLTPAEIAEHLASAGGQAEEWVRIMRSWASGGRGIILLREE